MEENEHGKQCKKKHWVWGHVDKSSIALHWAEVLCTGD